MEISRPEVERRPEGRHPLDCEEFDEGFEEEPIIQNEFGTTTIPLRNADNISNSIVELHNTGTQMLSLAAHGLQKALVF